MVELIEGMQIKLTDEEQQLVVEQCRMAMNATVGAEVVSRN